jgi:hypothetical protein
VASRPRPSRSIRGFRYALHPMSSIHA